MPNIGRYEIESRIGHGGMGDVYRAWDPTLRRRVAIKVLKVEGDAETLNRFRLEATAAANLTHPNIVTVHDYGVVDGEPYLVMEYLEGQDIKRTIESGKQFDLVEITDIMSQVSDALECAHQHGVIHRDVKPANIMLLSKGGVKLMDFGIARLAGANTQHTKAGHMIGTVQYMSPEQFHNLELDLRVDIWAYGVTYYELLAGKNPFEVQDYIVTAYNITNKPAPPICTLNKEVPEPLGLIVDRCLAKDRDQRYRSMEEVRFDALPVLQDLSKQQAARMLAEARILMEKSDLDAAHTLIRRVLDLDPADRAARELRKTVADALKKREIGPRIESLSHAAEQHVAAREYSKALEAIETALRLDSTQTMLRQRAEEVKELIERERRAAELLRAAKAELDTQNLTDAYRHATEALRYDPSLTEGTRLLASVQEEIARRERQKALQEGLSKARNLLRINSFDEAATVLKELVAEHPGTLEAAQLLREAENARDEERRRRRLQDELAAVKEKLRSQRFPEAVQHLEGLIVEFPGHGEAEELLRYAREEWRVRQRAEALDRVREQIAKLQNDGRFEEAVRFLERSRTEFPDEPDLQRLAQSVAANKAEADRRAALEHTIQEARGKHRSGEITEALRLVDLGLRQYGPDEHLHGLREQLERDWQNVQRKRALDKSINEGRQFAERREWEKAIVHFQNVTRQYPEEAEPRRLLAEAEASLAREHRERGEREALARVAAFEKQGQREAALAEIETAFRLYPDSAPLTQTRARLQREIEEERKAREREAKLEEARRKAQAEQQRRAQEAEEASEAQRRQVAAKVEECLAKAYLAIGQGELGKAAKMIAEARKTDANHPGVQRAQNDLQAEQERLRQQEAARGAAARAAEPPRPAKPFPVKGVAIGAGAAVAAAAAAFFLLQPKPPEPPKIQFDVSPQKVELAYTAGGDAPAPVNIDAKGNAGLAFAVKSSDSWILVSPEEGTLPATLVLNAKPDTLAPGPHTGSIEVSAGKTTERVAVSLTVKAAPTPTPVPPAPGPDKPPPPPEVKISPEFLSFNWQTGSPDPAAQNVYVLGSGRFQAALRNEQWVSITPSSGRIPGQVQVSVHPGRLPAGSSGSHTNQLTVTFSDAPGVQKVSTIRLIITEAPKPPPPLPPVDTGPKDTGPKCTAGGIYLGRRIGDLVWNGTLPPGGKVSIHLGNGEQAGGTVVGNSIPKCTAFDVSGLPSGVQATTAVNTLTLTNVSASPISTIPVHWVVK